MTVQAQKGNKILRISEDAVQRYLNMGYNIVGADGIVLEKAIPADNNQLKLEYTKLTAEIESLKETIESLNQKNVALTKENKKLTEELKSAKAIPVEKTEKDTEKTTTSTRRRKQTTEASE